MDYIPKFYDKEKSTIELNNLFEHKKCMEYAKQHKFDVVFTETMASCAIEIIVDFEDSGFSHSFFKVPVYDDNFKHLFDKILCRMSLDKKAQKDETEPVAVENKKPTKNDIFNWVCFCDDAETLRYLGKAALNRARAIENPDYDEFHSL